MDGDQTTVEIASIRARVPIQLSGGVKPANFYTFKNLCEPDEHFAIGLGPDVRIPLVRFHSECMTGDVFGSERCDCRHQLHEALRRIADDGGYLLYLRQEGRGIGLYNKLDTYLLQIEGMDTYEANLRLGYEADLRNYKAAAEMLLALGCPRIRLLSNNPDKRKQLEKHGITIVEMLPTGTFLTKHNQNYLKAKSDKMNHTLDIAAIRVNAT
ncbi:GTP cyclohydrolase II [Xanthomonas fragariae]|uniref:GTP cyclohydrolase II n=1 Tax=Xanthomonas fragariae TaxID=48664 RepID=UPI001ABE0428|nr:GTP cyclohydrolase II [Xanthomonas fragariae]UKR51864.1 GTP cyclohydrolase II [Xanthomonas fragariae]WAT13950.1 GTP cyclohydrolase II [Xanthomonas fragariae]